MQASRPTRSDRGFGSGGLIRVHRGVYRVGHRAPSVEATYLAAVLAAGEGALLSGRAAAHLFALTKGTAPTPEVITRTERRIEGVTTHRSRLLNAQDATTFRGIPVTTVPRTLVDIAAELSRRCTRPRLPRGRRPLRHHAQSSRGSARATADQSRRKEAPKGPPRRRPRDPLHPRSPLFGAADRRRPRHSPITNRPAGGRRVDCRWPEQRLTVELDGYQFHNSRHSWELDRLREREARARGDEFRRYTYGDVFERPALMLAELVSLI